LVLRLQNNPITYRPDRGTCGGREISSQVGPVNLPYRMKALGRISRTYSGKLNRIFEQGLPETFSFLIKIIQAFSLIERKGVIRTSKVFEIDRADLADAHGSSLDLVLLVNNFELITFLQPLKV